jgi:hypothetical protein
MNRASMLASRFREAILDGKFIANTNYKEQLSQVTWQQAVYKPAGVNSIALLTQHIHYYVHGVLQVLQGGSLDIHDKYSFSFPDINSEAQWLEVLRRFWADAEAFALALATLPEGKLDTGFVDEKYGTYQRNMDAMIEHCYYHLGQIVLLRKLIPRL